KGVLPSGMYAVPGKGAPLDAHGNVPSGIVRQVISQLQAGQEAGYVSNETERTRKRRRRRGGHDVFALKQKRGGLLPGIYQRLENAVGDAGRCGLGVSSRIRSLFVFVRAPQYRPRYEIFGMAARQYNKLMSFHFNRELDKAVQTSKFRGKG